MKHVHSPVATIQVASPAGICCDSIRLSQNRLRHPDRRGKVIILMASKTEEIQIKRIQIAGGDATVRYDRGALVGNIIPAGFAHFGILVSLLRMQ